MCIRFNIFACLKGWDVENEIKTTVQEMLAAIEDAITLAWSDTRKHVEDFDRRIKQTCFGQFLLGNVMHRVHQLNSHRSRLRVDLKPNRKGSAYHIELTTRGFLCTISSVRDAGDLPRYAHFRATIANSLQSFFTYTEDDREFQFCPPSPIDKSLRSYIQILHGPKDNRDQREELGFIRVAFLDRVRGEQWRVTTMPKLLEALSDVPSSEDVDLQSFLTPIEVPTEEILDLVSGQFSLLDQDIRVSRPTEDGGA